MRVSGQHAFSRFHEILVQNLARIMYLGNCGGLVFQEQGIKIIQSSFDFLKKISMQFFITINSNYSKMI